MDVAEVDGKELFRRKTMLFLRTVDPKRVTDALAGINTGMMDVLWNLKDFNILYSFFFHTHLLYFLIIANNTINFFQYL